MPIKAIRAPRNSKARSRVTNGKSLFPRVVDQRSLYYRRFRDVIDLLSADLGSDLSTAEQSIVRTAANVLAYNLTRVMNIVGIKPFLVAIRA